MVENMKEEIWKDVPDYEGYYQASNLGRVRSLDRNVLTTNGQERLYKGKTVKGTINNKGYRLCRLSINGVNRTFTFSQLVAMAFLGHETSGHVLVVDHKNGDRADDRLDNLRIVANRANTTTCFRSDKGSLSSEYVGVSWYECASKWLARIKHNGGSVHLGYYNTEIEASNTYQSALSKIKDGSFDCNDYKPKFTSEYKGVSFYKRDNKWLAYITINGKSKHIGLFKTEIEAHKAYLKEEKKQKLA